MADPGGSSETRTPVLTPSMFPGFKFSPTDVELITYYLKNKSEGLEKSVEIIPEVEISRHEPWDLPGQSVMESDNEWFFFSARGRKYPNGLQSKRTTTHGFWKATGKERSVKSGSGVVGTKRTLVFHIGRAPKGERTKWTMHEYCMEGRSQSDDLVVCRLRKNMDFRGSIRNPLAQGHSSDAHSAEKVDSTSENDQNLPNATTPVGPSTLGKELQDSDDDCFSAILKDELVKLDEESSLPGPVLLPVVATKSEPVPAVAAGLEQHAEQAPAEGYMRFLHQASDYKTHCLAQHLLSLRTMHFWQLPLILLCFYLLVLMVSFLVARKPFTMLLTWLHLS